MGEVERYSVDHFREAFNENRVRGLDNVIALKPQRASFWRRIKGTWLKLKRVRIKIFLVESASAAEVLQSVSENNLVSFREFASRKS